MVSDPTWFPGSSDEPVPKPGRRSRDPGRSHQGHEFRERGLPAATTEHPAWPAFRRWADEHLGDVMLGVYWDCWRAAWETARRGESAPVTEEVRCPPESPTPSPSGSS